MSGRPLCFLRGGQDLSVKRTTEVTSDSETCGHNGLRWNCSVRQGCDHNELVANRFSWLGYSAASRQTVWPAG